MTIKVFQGEREIAAGNKGLGEFNLEGIPPASRGTPQIEVTFDIDANGILHVGAKDKATGKENKITIKANSGLTEAEIQKMVKDAEVNAEEDKKVKELAESRNGADALVHSTKKSLTEHGDKLEAAEKDRDRRSDRRAGRRYQIGRQGRHRCQDCHAEHRGAETGREDVRRHAGTAGSRWRRWSTWWPAARWRAGPAARRCGGRRLQGSQGRQVSRIRPVFAGLDSREGRAASSPKGARLGFFA